MTSSRPSPPVLALLVAAGVVVAQALLVPLFGGVAANLEPHDLPVVVAGPAPAADEFADQLAQARPGAFDITRLDGAEAADQALRDREAYAAFVLGPDGARAGGTSGGMLSLHTASAASPAVAQLLTQAAAELGGGQPVPVEDVVPASPDDPRGAGLSAGFLPLALTSMLAGLALAVVVPGWRSRLLGLIGYAVLAGLVATAILQGGLGILEGDYLWNAAVIALFALAVAATVAGLGAALGGPGLGLGVLVAFLVGNPLSAVTSAPELITPPWGEVGQWLPAGAGATLLRSAAWFDWAGSARPLWVLTGWAVFGVVLVLVGRATLAPGHPAARSRGPVAGRGAITGQSA
jgi:hypothetical protein